MIDKTINTLIFDFGGVLMRTADPRPRRDLERCFDLEPGEVLRLVFESPRWDDVQLGRISSDTFWDDVGDRLGLDDDKVDQFRRGFWEGDRLDQELVSLIRHMRDQGYQTALLSNAPRDLRDYLGKLGIDDAFDIIVVSGEVGMMKPSPEIYHHILKLLDVEPEEAVFIDDMSANVEAARRVGLHATRFRGVAPLRVWLRDLGIPAPDPSVRPVSAVEAVVFDWGGVMEELPGDDDIARWERRLGVASGVLPEVLWGDAWRQLEVGAISDEAYVQVVTDRLDLADEAAALRFLQLFYTTDRFNEEVMEAARALRDRYSVALLSNAFPSQAEVVHSYHGIDVHAEFDVYVNSALVGLSKPHPGIYELTLERLGVEPERTIFLDDNLRNVDSAGELGIHAIQFVNPRVSLPQLESLLGHAIAP